MTQTRANILAAAGRLLHTQGLAGTGIKQIAAESGAPFGSIYHHFPGGKSELAEEVIRTDGVAYGEHVFALFDSLADLPAAMQVGFAVAAEVLVRSGYADACPIATIALEVASTDERLRRATADVFTGWIDGGPVHLPPGLDLLARRRWTLTFLCALEGAFVLARALRSTEPLDAAGQTLAAAVRAELAG